LTITVFARHCSSAFLLGPIVRVQEPGREAGESVPAAPEENMNALQQDLVVPHLIIPMTPVTDEGFVETSFHALANLLADLCGGQETDPFYS
jgi:hypothetical protein